MSRRDHWERVYASKPREQLGWYRPRLDTTLAWLDDLGLPADAAIIDIGGGASTLVDDVLERGYEDVTVLDVSGTALELARSRLGERADDVTWIHADVTSTELPADRYDLWHDRAAFHFLVDDGERRAYLATLERGLKAGGHAILGVFAPEAPERCSGLPVRRYDVAELSAALGDAFVLERHRKELHVTPGGTEQMYLYARFRHDGA